jgi:hypothetical protein
MNTPHTSALAAPRRHRQKLLAIALVGALAATIAQAQTDSGFYRPLTLAPAEPAAGGGGGDAAAQPAAGGNGGADNTAELAIKLQNPIAALISVPLQNNFDFGAGPKGDGFQYLVRIQPVIPISLSEDWNLISRTILPVIYQQNYIGTTKQSGLGDTIQNLFFSPKALWHGWTWGAGPVFQFPTATDDLLGAEKWCLGPTVVVLKQAHGFTYGTLMNQFTSFAGNDGRQDVNYMFLQPFFTYTTKTRTSFAVNSESTYNWQASQWTVPLNFMVQQLVKFGKQPVAFQVGYRYYAAKPDNGPDWGLRFTITFLFPNR